MSTMGVTMKRVGVRRALGALGVSSLLLVTGCSQEVGSGEASTEQTAQDLYLDGTPWTNGVVNVCYDHADGNNPGLLAEAKDILTNTWSKSAKVTFVGWDECQPGAIYSKPYSNVALHFQPGIRGSTSYKGMPQQAGFGHGDAVHFSAATTQIYLVNDDYSVGQQHFTYEVIHEFGHALGWAHEQERPDNWSGGTPLYCGQLDDGRQAISGGRYETSYFDYASIMDYCIGWANQLSAGDMDGIRKVYGSHVKFTTGDFDGDGFSDVIITTPRGSYWYYGAGTGVWNNLYSRTDLTLDTVDFTTGDFNGDHHTDMIITTASGSYWYFGAHLGTWVANAYVRTDLKRGAVQYTTGDFDGNGSTDLIITTNTGSSWYYATGRGTFQKDALLRPDLVLGVVAYKTADFDGDGSDDMIITTNLGSTWFYARGVATWTDVMDRGDLPIGSVSFAVGNFDGDAGHKADVIITSVAGTNTNYSLGVDPTTGQAIWSSTAVRSDLGLTTSSYLPLNFDGDQTTDYIVSTREGSFWYTGAGRLAYSRPDLPVGTAAFTAADFDATGRDDVIIQTSGGSDWYYSNADGSSWTDHFSRPDLGL